MTTRSRRQLLNAGHNRSSRNPAYRLFNFRNQSPSKNNRSKSYSYFYIQINGRRTIWFTVILSVRQPNALYAHYGILFSKKWLTFMTANKTRDRIFEMRRIRTNFSRAVATFRWIVLYHMDFHRLRTKRDFICIPALILKYNDTLYTNRTQCGI